MSILHILPLTCVIIVVAIPCDLTLVDIQPSLGHVSHAPLRLLSGKGAEVMDKGSFIRDLKVTDTAVTLLETSQTLKTRDAPKSKFWAETKHS